MQGWGSRAISGTHTGVTGRHWPITKIRFYFPSGCVCTTSIPRAMTLSPRSASTPAAHGPLPARPWGAGTPLPGPAPCGQPRPRSVLPPHCQLQGQCQCGASLGSAAATSGEQLPPSPLRSLGWRVLCWLRLPVPLSQVGAAGPRLISATLAGASPLAPSGSCPRGPSDCPAERGGRATMGCLGGGHSVPTHLSTTPTPPWGPTVRWPVAQSWGSSVLPGVDRLTDEAMPDKWLSGWLGGGCCGGALQGGAPLALSPCRTQPSWLLIPAGLRPVARASSTPGQTHSPRQIYSPRETHTVQTGMGRLRPTSQ